MAPSDVPTGNSCEKNCRQAKRSPASVARRGKRCETQRRDVFFAILGMASVAARRTKAELTHPTKSLEAVGREESIVIPRQAWEFRRGGRSRVERLLNSDVEWDGERSRWMYTV